MFGALIATHQKSNSRKNRKGEIMKFPRILKTLSVFMVICASGVTASPAYSQEKGKAKGNEKTETKGKHGREGGELPYGIEHRTEKKGALPSGLQKKKDEEGQLTRGLEQGGKDLKSPSKAKKLPSKHAGQAARGNSGITTAGGHGNSGQAKGHAK
jgi:hypothetical protein